MCLKKMIEMLSFSLQICITSYEHVRYTLNFYKLSEPVVHAWQKLPDKIM